MNKIFSKRAVIMTLVALSLSVGFLPRQARAASANESSAEAYTVRIPGDSLWRIAQRTCDNPLQWKTIADANGIVDAPYWVMLGQSLIIPCTAHDSATQPAMPTKVVPAVLPLVPAPPISAHTASTPVIKAVVPKKESKHSFKKMIAWSGGSAGIVVILLLFLFYFDRKRQQREEDREVVKMYEAPQPVMQSTPQLVPQSVAPAAIRFTESDLITLHEYVTQEDSAVVFTFKGIYCLALFDYDDTKTPRTFVIDRDVVYSCPLENLVTEVNRLTSEGKPHTPMSYFEDKELDTETETDFVEPLHDEPFASLGEIHSGEWMLTH